MKQFLILFFLILASGLNGQNSSTTWNTLGKITFKKEFDAALGFKIDKPIFGEEIKALSGKIVEIKGYIIPTDGYKSHTEFILSAFPYNMCFFCGGAGPETVMEIYAKTPVKFTSEAVTLRGKLELNENDVNRLIYAMTEAEQVDAK
ncbi:MAG TPA: hypothetical protein PKM27_16910 [Saprospiraceae bacterium]|nr:hypothetical protein [Saprospiraceae bacterium]HNT20290.1 hypothetical protein [Saprospiraceae bacterium]